jgi:hypothetical protein
VKLLPDNLPSARFFVCLFSGSVPVGLSQRVLRPWLDQAIGPAKFGDPSGLGVFKFVLLFWSVYLVLWMCGSLCKWIGVLPAHEARRFPFPPDDPR